MTDLLDEHRRHGLMPLHVLAAVGTRLGVEACSVATRYGTFVRHLAETDPFDLTESSRRLLKGTTDFREAFHRLDAAGGGRHFAVVERALWADGSVALTSLRVAERRRRQTANEIAVCELCARTDDRTARERTVIEHAPGVLAARPERPHRDSDLPPLVPVLKFVAKVISVEAVARAVGDGRRQDRSQGLQPDHVPGLVVDAPCPRYGTSPSLALVEPALPDRLGLLAPGLRREASTDGGSVR
jgi:hypothetical protein